MTQVKQIPSQYDDAAEVEEIALKIIPKYYPMLADANIKYLFSNKPVKKLGKTVVASIEKCKQKMKYLTGLDYIIQAGYEEWNNLTDDQRIAVIDHELCHAVVEEEEESGEVTYKLRDHDFSEFRDVVLRHGTYLPDLEGLDKVFSGK